MPGTQGECEELGPRDVDPGGRSCHLVVAYRQEPPADAGASEIGNRDAEERQQDPAEDDERRVLVLLSGAASADVDAEERRLLDERRDAGTELGDDLVLQVERLDRHGGGDGHHGQLDPAYSDRREADDDSDYHGDGHPDRSGDRPRQTGALDRDEVRTSSDSVRHHAGREEGRDAGKRHLRQRDLPGVPGEHDEREAHDREDQTLLQCPTEASPAPRVLEHEREQ